MDADVMEERRYTQIRQISADYFIRPSAKIRFFRVHLRTKKTTPCSLCALW